MKDMIEMLSFEITGAGQMLQLFTADLKGADWLHRPMTNSNCAAWLVGHLVMVDRRVIKAIGGELPVVPGDFEKRFSRDDSAPQAEQFGDTSILMPLFAQHREELLKAVKTLLPADLDRALDKPSPRYQTIGQMLLFTQLHVAMHAGHISLIRRSLGRPPII